MPKKKQSAGNRALNAPAPEEQAPEKAKNATRIAQPKEEGETQGETRQNASKPRAARAKKAQEAPEDKKEPLAAQEDTPSKPARKRTAPTKKAVSKEEAAKEAPACEEQAPVCEAPVPALSEPASALPVQADAQQGIEIAVPPVAFPTLQGERRQFWGRILLLLLVGALLTISVLIFVYRPTRYSAYSHSIVFLHHSENNTTQVLYDGKSCAEGIVGACVRSERNSSGSVCAALISDTLYLVRGDDVEQIAASVLDFALSQNGRALAYRTAEQQLFYVKIGGKLKTSSVSLDTRDARYCLSPDGELLFYTYAEQTDAGEIKSHADVFSLSGDKPRLPHTTDMIPVAIADDYEHIFYFNGAGDLYYMNGKGEISLCRRRGESEMELLFDREFEELLVKDADGMTLWQKGAPTVLSGLKGAEYLFLLANQSAVYREMPCAKQCLVRSLDENYYLKLGTQEQGREMVYLDGNELRAVAFIDVGGSEPVVTDKGVYYLERVTMEDEVRKQLYRCPIGQITPQTLAFDVSSFEVNSDGSRLLYADHREALYAARVVGDALDATRISDHADPASLCVSASDAFYYRSTEGTWYVSDNGNEPKQISIQGSVYTDVHTAFFFVAERAVSDGDSVSATYTVYTNHRNRRENKKVATGVDLPFVHQ